MNPFALAVILLQLGAGVWYTASGQWKHGLLWGLYAAANVLLFSIAREAK